MREPINTRSQSTRQSYLHTTEFRFLIGYENPSRFWIQKSEVGIGDTSQTGEDSEEREQHD